MVITADLKEALRKRPGASDAVSSPPALTPRQLHDQSRGYHNGRPCQTYTLEGGITVRSLWTPQEFRTYRHLLDRVMSERIGERAEAQVWLKRFKEKHGEEICEMMLAEIRRQDATDWFERKRKNRSTQ